MNQADARREIVRWGKSLFERGLTSGASGNITVKVEGGYLATPTNSCLGFLAPERLSLLDAKAALVSGDAPTKELPLHMAFYRSRPVAGAVVHLHSTYATALSCLADVDVNDAIPTLTPYIAMRLGQVPLLPYTRPGSQDIVAHIEAKAPNHPGVLLSNHGPVVAGADLDAAVYGIEELEESAKLAILTRGLAVRSLSHADIADLKATFPSK